MQQCWRRIGGQRRSELLGSSRRRDAASPDSWYFSITAAGLRQCIACHVGWRVVWWCRSSCHWVALRTRGVLVGRYGAHGLACGHGHVQGSRLGTAWPASPVSSVGERACMLPWSCDGVDGCIVLLRQFCAPRLAVLRSCVDFFHVGRAPLPRAARQCLHQPL